MTALARFAVARPKQVLAVWLVGIGLLGAIGVPLEKDLHQKAELSVPGTPSEKAEQLANQRFGKTTVIPIMLTGPRRALDRQGPQLAATLERQGMTVLAPWRLRDQSALRPKPTAMVLYARSPRAFDDTSTHVIPQVRKDLNRLQAPVKGHVTGNVDIAHGLHVVTVETVRRAELLAAPLLMIVLLFVFRSVVAAALPLNIGLTTIIAGRGVLDLVNRVYPLDGIALNLMAMMGLALGVDYALLLVSRYREELDAGVEPHEAAIRTVGTAGRTVVFAGIVVVGAMAAALPISPGALLASSTTGIVVAGVISVVAAVTALPAALVLLGERINRFSLPRARGADSRVAGVALRALRRPVVACAAVLALILALAAPVTRLDMGPPSAYVMPKSHETNKDFAAFQHTLGTGWTSPYEVIVASKRGPITDRKTLRALNRFQQQLKARRDVVAVLGPGEIAQRTSRLDSVPDQLAQADDQLHGAINDQNRLKGGLSSAAGGVDDLTNGLASASTGAQQLQAGGSRAAQGAELLAGGIARARAGADRMGAGLASAGDGAKALEAGAGRARTGIGQLHGGLMEARKREHDGAPQVTALANALDRGGRDLSSLREPAQTADDQLSTALKDLDAMLATSKADPKYRELYTAVATAKGAISGRNPTNGKSVKDGYDGLDKSLAQAAHQSGEAADGVRKLGGELGRLESGLAKLQGGAAKVNTGTGRLQGGLGKLVTGLSRLGGGGSDLSSGLARLESAGQQLASGTRSLQGGAGQLQQGLASGAGRTGELRAGLGRMEQGVATGTAKTKQMAGGLGDTKQLSALTGSGYFSLAAIDGSSPTARKTASFALNVDRGGSAVRYEVIGKGNVTREGHPLRPVLAKMVAQLGRDTGTEARLGGFATRLQDYEHAERSRFWLLVAVLAVIAYVLLVPVLRSVVLPALAVALTALPVAAAFGVLVLCFQGAKPMGGPGYIDAIMVYGVYTIAFALAIDYQCFLLARVREGYTLTGTTEGAVSYGLRHTAGVVTGAAISMAGVFLAFAVPELTFTRQLGIGLSVAVILDATLVRLVLLPAAIRLCGRACWWLPAPLERLFDARPRRVAPPAAAPAPAPLPDAS